jgi:hypothetical protein
MTRERTTTAGKTGPKSSLDLVEEASYLLRRSPAGALAAYCVGTLPFVLAFLFFWADMGRNALAYEHCAQASLGIAALYLWMSVWQAVFAQGLRGLLTGSDPAPVRRLAVVQATLQPTKLIVIPVAALLTFPLGAVFAWYQNLMAVSYEESRGIRDVAAAARRQAGLWQMQNWAVLGIVGALAVVIFANIGVLLLLIPQLLKSLFGVETVLARSEVLMLNSTFLAVTATLTYVIIDPLIKAIYVLRCFYGESLTTGEDLKAQLKAIASQVAVIAALIAAGLNGSLLRAQERKPLPQHISVQDMDRSIDDVLKRPEFAWRLPHRKASQPNKTWMGRMLGDFLDKLDRWSDEFSRWLHERFKPKPAPEPRKEALPALRVWYYGLLGVAILVFVFLFARIFSKRQPETVTAEAVTMAVPDLASDETRADQLPPEEWLRTARDCAARNDLRLAIRALFFANLAYLGGRSLIAIDRGKSNGDYARELRRRARAKPEILPVFSDTVGVFERSWYGMHDVNAELVERVEANLVKTRADLEQ